MEKLRKFGFLLFLLFFVSAFVVGCGEEENSSSSGDESYEIRVATWQTEETAMELFKKAKEAYEDKHPNATVKIETAPYEDYMTKLQTELAAGDPADIIQVGEQNFQRYVESETIVDLQPYAEGSFDFENEIVPNVKELMKVDGQFPVMSVGAATIGVYYNKKLFDEANLPYPEEGWTWEEFVDLAEKLTIRDGDRYVQYGANLNLGKDYLETFIVSNGGSYLSEDGTTAKGYLNSSETIEAFTKISDLYNVSQVAPNPAELEALKGIDLFATGQVAMNVEGSWAQADLQNDPEMEFGVVSLPTMSTGERTSLMYTSGMGISSTSDMKEEAWDFLYELTSPETEAGAMWAESNLAVTKKLLDSTEQAEDPYLGLFVDQLDYAIESSFYKNSYWGSVGDKLLDPAIQEILLDPNIDIEKRLTELSEQIDRELKQASE
ncbi:ABC transporter substrate-binding protein [Gracilibacillus sp. D59]|uniref:ABC transporter substrate-binding protein n=1 Tax=Gracilibacillus sp. D59 TaxID=3457434 RepID=UPI003FCDCD44